ncbi:hypothetical protein F5B22DRAFT_347000 [Xylaria bambusicola]|uniref:uncharacterized protein n=1 Tax=Xylaria bambusicola TaxID=326684 RepID=UPI0020080978|nr:uncharacterized protein F5B22DRAFT_347000 [Xylaria bambusicola]KAI0525557.1 hypothetical protein F5B22DRAFT_347000 [Xylaria bambusicola]
MVGQSHGGKSMKMEKVGRKLRSEKWTVERDGGRWASRKACRGGRAVSHLARLQFSQHIWRLETGFISLTQAAVLIDKLEVSLYQLASRRNADGAAPDCGERERERERARVRARYTVVVRETDGRMVGRRE